MAVFRPSLGKWFVRNIETAGFSFGTNGDIPISGDYNGNGTTDYAVFRPATGSWWASGILNGTVWGVATDLPISGRVSSECGNHFTGRHNTKYTGDARFVCLNNRWYDCGWSGNDLSWNTKATNNQRVGNWTCNLSTSTWVSTP
jgi:hypothetical protein